VTDSGGGEIYLGIPGIDSVAEIGRSATHTTYRARDVSTGRTTVVKLLNAGREWPGLQARFEREQTAMAGLAHPNIVQVFGHGWTETGMPYIVTGEAPGGSIGDRLTGANPMTGPDILALGVRMAGALESAHRVGVVHGDLRPDDMMLSPTGEPMLADFGVVTLVRPNAGAVTDPADLAHVAPELLDGTPATPSSDIYSLTSAMYTLFAGIPAYVRPGEQSVVPVIKRIASDPLPDLSSKNVPAPVVDAITKGMAKEPGERHRTAQELGRSLQQAQVALGLPMTEMVLLGTASAATAAQSVTRPVTAAAPPLAPSPAAPPLAATGPPAKNRTALVAGIIAGVVILALVAFFATRGGDSKKNATASSSSVTSTTRKTTTTTTTNSTETTPPGGTDVVTNDGGQLELEAPTEWSDHNGKAADNGAPELQVSTNLVEFNAGTYRDPGADVAVFAASVLDPSKLDGALDAIGGLDRAGGKIDDVCTHGDRQDFTPGGANLSEGRTERLTGCNGGGDVILIAATNADHTFTVVAEIHLGDPADEQGASTVFDSINVVKFP